MAGLNTITFIVNFHYRNITQVNESPLFLITEMMYHLYYAYIIKLFHSMFTINIKIHTHENRQSDHFNILLYQKKISNEYPLQGSRNSNKKTVNLLRPIIIP